MARPRALCALLLALLAALMMATAAASAPAAASRPACAKQDCCWSTALSRARYCGCNRVRRGVRVGTSTRCALVMCNAPEDKLPNDPCTDLPPEGDE